MEAEDIRKKFGELPTRGLGWAALFAISIVLFVIQAIEKLAKGTAFVGSLIVAGVSVDGGKVTVAVWLVLLISMMIALLVLLAIQLAHSATARSLERDKLKAAEESIQKAQRCFTEAMHAASVIRSKQTPDATHTVKIIEEVNIEYRVEKDFTASITQRFTVKAAEAALHFWETSIQPSSDASPVEYLSDIQFRAVDVTDPKKPVPVTYLQTLNDVRFKKVCLYFLPRLMRNDPARVIEISYRWPAYLIQLEQRGGEDLFQILNSAGPTVVVTMDIWFEDGMGGTAAIDVVSTYPNTLTTLTDVGRSGFRYEAKDLPPGRHEHKLSAS